MNKLTNFILIAILVGSAFFVGLQFGASGKTSADVLNNFRAVASTEPAGVDFSPLWKAWHLLEEKYVPATTTPDAGLSAEDRVWGAIQGLAESYDDPYTSFLPPVENEMFEEEISGEFGGVGMEIGKRDGLITVIAPLKDTPADRAGILAGDKVIQIDGKSTENMTVDEAVQNIRGEIGTEVVLKIAREVANELLDIEITRDNIKIRTITTTKREDGIFVIELYNFGATAPSEFRRALREYILSGSTKLIIDLRGNPGGFLEASVDIASWFLPAGKIIVQEHFGDGKKAQVHRSKGYNVYKPHWDVVVLMNQGSASASEIVAGALSEHGIATLIGMQTFGKGSVQELVDVTPDTAIKITIARWLTPHGVSISENGLAPDIEVDVTIEDIEAEKDPQLDRAIEFLLTGS